MSDSFFSADGQARRRALDQFNRDISETLRFYLGPTGIQDRLGFAAEVNPVRGAERSGEASGRMLAPGASPSERLGAGAEMLGEVAAIGGPLALGARGAYPMYQAVQDAFLGASVPARAAAGEAASGIRAYHGSPHDFDRFDMSKIGTGEGAQAYGSGLYFAENEAVARMYRDQLAGGNTSAARRTLEAAEGDVDQAITQTRQRIDRLNERAAAGDFGGDERRFAAQRQIQEDKLQQLLSFKETGSFDPGRMYEVNIRANPEDFLDWDAPLSEQTGRVANLLADYEALGSPVTGAAGQDWMLQMGGNYLRSGAPNPSAEVSAYLAREGIPGIRYLDAGSRGVGEGSRNLVVFDDNLIDIVRKYGIAGAAALLGVSVADVEQAFAQNIGPINFDNIEGLVSGPQ
jgi:hypothetical protein